MSNKTIIAAVVAVIVVIAAIAGCVVAFSNNNGSDCTVTWEPNYIGSPHGEKTTYRSGTELTEPVYLHRADYTHAGWYLDKECTNKVTFPYKVDKNVTLYAGWTTDAASKYFNENFYFDNEFGKRLAESLRETTDFKELTIDGKNIKFQLESAGINHAVLRDNEKSKFVVVDLNNRKALFDIHIEKGMYVKSVSALSCNNEFIILDDNGKYTIYDLHGHSFGPADAEPIILIRSMVLFNNNCYKFDDKGDLKFDFEVTSTHIPFDGNGNTFCELEGISITEKGEIHYDRINMLDSQFNVIKSVPAPSNAVRFHFYYLNDGNYFLQYSMATSDADYSYIDDDIHYKLATFIINEKSQTHKNVSMAYPAFAKTDMTVKKGFVTALAYDIKNIISCYNLDENKKVDLNSKLLFVIGNDGIIKKQFNPEGMEKYAFQTMMPMVQPGKYLISVSFDNGEKVEAMTFIVDGTGEHFECVLSLIQPTECDKYFTLIPELGDFSIYNAEGKVIGNFEGRTLVGSTNNLLFFEDMNGDLSVFRDGKMESVPDYKDELICMESFYGYSTGNVYKFFTESGKYICDNQTGECKEMTTKAGTHIAEFYIGNGNFSIVELTAGTR